MIIQELEHELSAVEQTMEAAARWDQREGGRHLLVEELRAVRAALKAHAPDGNPRSAEQEQERAQLKRRLERSRTRLHALEAECTQLEQEIERAFHPYWGPLLKCGAEPSSFGHQVETYACLYTTRVSNLGGYSPLHYFRSPRERLPHEL
jgi:5'-nucleotidase